MSAALIVPVVGQGHTRILSNRRGRDHPNFDCTVTAAGGSLGFLTGDLRKAPVGLRRWAIEVLNRGLSLYGLY